MASATALLLEAHFGGQIGADQFLLRLARSDTGSDIGILRDRLNLTARESEVLLWVGRAKTNRDIGAILSLSPRTVNKHLEQIFTKIGIENRATAAVQVMTILQGGRTSRRRYTCCGARRPDGIGVSGMQIGVDSFVAVSAETGNQGAGGLSPVQRMADLLAEVEVADRVGLDHFGIGEHHRADFLDSAPTIILAAAAARTRNIRLTSAVTVLSAADPVRVFQEFATLDLVSNGRAEIIAGRGSFTEAHALFGFRLEDYDALFAEKLDLLLRIRDEPALHWSGRFRPALAGQAILPRPLQAVLPIWLGVGGTPQSFVRAGTLGLPLMIAIIGGEFRRFRPLVDMYREAGARAGHPPERLKVGIHAFGFVADDDATARAAYFPGWAASMTKIGRERGWPPATRQQFEAAAGPEGAFLIGGPATVAERMLRASHTLGGLARISVQMTAAAVPHAIMARSIELLGTTVAPVVRRAMQPGTMPS